MLSNDVIIISIDTIWTNSSIFLSSLRNFDFLDFGLYMGMKPPGICGELILDISLINIIIVEVYDHRHN